MPKKQKISVVPPEQSKKSEQVQDKEKPKEQEQEQTQSGHWGRYSM